MSLRLGRRLPRRSLFPGLAFFDFRVVMADDAADSGAGDRMMTSHMSGDPTDGGAFQATFGLNNAGKCHQRDAYEQDRYVFAHTINLSGVISISALGIAVPATLDKTEE
jgi:hypothetical protein